MSFVIIFSLGYITGGTAAALLIALTLAARRRDRVRQRTSIEKRG
jgi:hypothetical protein